MDFEADKANLEMERYEKSGSSDSFKTWKNKAKKSEKEVLIWAFVVGFIVIWIVQSMS